MPLMSSLLLDASIAGCVLAISIVSLIVFYGYDYGLQGTLAAIQFQLFEKLLFIIYKNGQVKVYVDQYRVLVVPNLGTPHAFDIEGIGGAEHPIVLANFRVASGGGMYMLGQKFTDAKIVTHGINFDIDKAVILPQSMGVLNDIKAIMTDNPDLKFEIDGHTDNTGGAAHNITLSQQRADAVKAQLISMGISASRLTTKGFGDTKPMSNNVTPEGKANNRRVEFVKQ